MPFVKFEVESKPTIDVRLSANGITINQDSLSTFNLGSSDYVNLYWDGDLHLIGIAPSSKEDKSSFKISQRGRGQGSKFIAANKFFDKFGISGDSTVASGLKDADGIAAFEVNVPTAATALPYTGKRRGRKPKAAAEVA